VLATECYKKVLRVALTEKVKNTDILKHLNIREEWLINDIQARKIKYFSHTTWQFGEDYFGRQGSREKRQLQIKEKVESGYQQNLLNMTTEVNNLETEQASDGL
jgi:hypothetical protein